MFKISDLPTETTPFDISLINEVSQNLLISNSFYNATGMEVKANTYNAETKMYQGEYDTITMFEGIQTVKGEFSFNDLNYIPKDNEVFDGFIEELSIKELGNSQYQLINEYSGAFVLYSEGAKHPFSVTIEEKTLEFDTFLIAAKFAFENACKSHEYMPPDSRKRIADFKEYLETEEFENSLQAQIQEAQGKQKSIDAFLEDDFMNWVLKLPKLLKEANMTCISSEDYAYNESVVTAVMPADVFDLMMDAAFAKGNMFEDKECIFKNENIIHGGLHFGKVYGQGVSLSISLAC